MTIMEGVEIVRVRGWHERCSHDSHDPQKELR